MTVNFGTQRPWVLARVHGLLREASGAEPVTISFRESWYGLGGEMFVIGNAMPALEQVMARDGDLRAFVAASRRSAPGPVRLTTDDWPYFYLERARIPTLHLCLSAILILLCVLFRGFAMP
jgi:hypothetical protein